MPTCVCSGQKWVYSAIVGFQPIMAFLFSEEDGPSKGGIMMLLLSCRNVKKSYADIDVLCGVDLDIQEGDRIGLVGVNGAGKSTLADLIFGTQEVDEGVILQYRSPLKVGYLLQSKGYLFNHRCSAEEGEEADHMDGFYAVSRGLGIHKVQHWEAERFQGISGGEKTKLALAEIWAERPDFLILDEPTNHLDFAGVEWLVKELARFKGTVLVISHDRYFLDQVVRRIVEMEKGIVTDYPGNYTAYREEKARQHAQQLHVYQVQKRKQEQIELEINRLKEWSAKAHREAGKVGKMAEMRMGIKEFYRAKAKKMDNQVKSRIKRLERLQEESVTKPEEEPHVAFLLKDAAKHGRRFMEVREVSKCFGERCLFRNSSFYVQRGEKVGLLGPNGCGKTTLIRMILGEEPLDDGSIWVSPSARLGYLSQDVSELPEEESVLHFLGLEGLTFIDRARTVLANLGFDDAMVEKRLGQLSMGERLRVKLAHLILDQADFLILDEPTNHLDLYSREKLEDALASFEGTMLIVSHDRYMLERLCTHMLIFHGDQIQKIQGNFKDYLNWLERRKNTNLQQWKEEMMVTENRMTIAMSRLNHLTPESPEYLELDNVYKELLQRKRELLALIHGKNPSA